jgi:hypothetical protein
MPRSDPPAWGRDGADIRVQMKYDSKASALKIRDELQPEKPNTDWVIFEGEGVLNNPGSTALIALALKDDGHRKLAIEVPYNMTPGELQKELNPLLNELFTRIIIPPRGRGRSGQ